MKKTTNFKNQKGQGVLEYIIISSLVGIFCLAAVGKYGEVLNKRIKNMTSNVSERIQLK
ncbi:hypothetical protein M899_2527 [Bacteriovorax sp. BSW11_IV]|uniref:hypothetical protein n=1 Tax=Bacteriovorax sp. BSW11_IV TaxID=1353529 RepID=UPI00038A47A7|nr:hypothetical protein [Bacteriovorax sp. BSW11_IV]EQC50361.1 hypothetical protein M899_2527 [Bacteriovorax sp. BSW11_IV]